MSSIPFVKQMYIIFARHTSIKFIAEIVGGLHLRPGLICHTSHVTYSLIYTIYGHFRSFLDPISANPGSQILCSTKAEPYIRRGRSNCVNLRYKNATISALT
jgi:hypothetical protein